MQMTLKYIVMNALQQFNVSLLSHIKLCSSTSGIYVRACHKFYSVDKLYTQVSINYNTAASPSSDRSRMKEEREQRSDNLTTVSDKHEPNTAGRLRLHKLNNLHI